MFLRYGLLGVICQVLFYLALFAFCMQLILKVWPVALSVLVLTVVLVVWLRQRKKRHKRA